MIGRSFPAARLLTQIVRQIAIPLSKRVVRYGRSRPLFKKYFLILPGQFVHWADARLKLLTKEEYKLSLTKDGKVMPLSESAAMDVGAHFMIEFLVFALIGGSLLYESYRTSARTAEAEDRRAREFQNLVEEKEELAKLVDAQDRLVQRLRLIVFERAREAGIRLQPGEVEADGRSH